MGIQLIHLGIIMLLIGQLATQAMQEESRMQINKGESKNYLERFHGVELAFIDVTNPDSEHVVALPQDLLENGGTHYSKDLPFKVKFWTLVQTVNSVPCRPPICSKVHRSA